MAAGNKEIDGTANIGTTARMLSQNLPRLGNAARESGTNIIFINQIRMKIGEMFGNPETTPGGMALKFVASLRLEIRKRKPEEKDGKEGNMAKIVVKKSKISVPFRETEIFIEYGKGFDIQDDLIMTAITLNISEKGGAWLNYKGTKFQGMNGLLEALTEKPELRKEIAQSVLDYMDEHYGSN
jgi:recombination protein RecA